MNSTGVLDDYLDELLGEAIAPAAVVLPTPDSAAPAPDSTSEPEREPTWDDLPAEVIYETDTVAAGPAVDNATLEAAFE
ncbi:MAG: chemotaxis protein CheW, partial [Stenotrophomonas maltophilia]|nr:chemotaxis protein CheW [Stenotrophomonas maltophilia]